MTEILCNLKLNEKTVRFNAKIDEFYWKNV